MPHWLIKSAVHRVVSWLPQRQIWNGLLQTYITKTTTLTRAGFEIKLAECRRHLEALYSVHPGMRGFRVLEVGTGWFPVLPVGLYLCGAERIWTFDIDPWLSSERVATTLEYFCEYASEGKLRDFLPYYQSDRLERLRSLLPATRLEKPNSMLAHIQIHAAIADARETQLPSGSIDLLFSNGVLQDIPRPVLVELFAEFRRLGAPGSVTSHRLYLADKFSTFDRSITAFNFLRFTSAHWKWLDSPMNCQNRLRISDFRELLGEAGFQIIYEDNIAGSTADLAKIKLAPEFRHYSQADLLVLHSYLIARCPPR